MTENEERWGIDEFVSYSLKDEPKNGFTIIMSGPRKYRHLLAKKIEDIRISKDELQEWVEQEKQ